MALTYRSPLEENFASYDSSVQAAIASTSASFYKDLEQENFRFFNYYVRPECKKHLIDSGIYVSPNAAVPHSHATCKTLENHFLYIVLPPLVDNSFFFVGIKDSKIGLLKSRNSQLTMVNKLNRYVTSLDRIRYGPDFVVRATKPILGMKRHQPVLEDCTLKDLVPPLMERSAKRLFLHDELHYWSHRDLITFLEVLKPEVLLATFVFPPEILSGSEQSLNKWCYTFEMIKGDLIFYPDGVRTEGYQQPLSSGYLLKTRRLILNNGDFYNVDVVQSKFAHHLISITKGRYAGPTIRAFGPFQATSCKGLEPLTRNVTNCFPISFEVVSRIYRYLRTLKKPDPQSAMAKLSQLLPEPDGIEIKFLQEFADLVINTKTVHTMIQVDHLTLFMSRWLKKMPSVIASKIRLVQSVSLDDFISMLEPFTFHVELLDVDWSHGSLIGKFEAEAEPDIDLIGLMDGKFSMGMLPEFAPRVPAPIRLVKKYPWPDMRVALAIGRETLRKFFITCIGREFLHPTTREFNCTVMRVFIEAKIVASKNVVLPKGSMLSLIRERDWVKGCVSTIRSVYGRRFKLTCSEDRICWLLRTERFHEPRLTNVSHHHGTYRSTANEWAKVVAELSRGRPLLQRRTPPIQYLPRSEVVVHEEVVPEEDAGVTPEQSGEVGAHSGCKSLNCSCGVQMDVVRMIVTGDHCFKSPDRLKNRNVGWYSKHGLDYFYTGGTHKNLGWPAWLELWMELNSIDTTYYNSCLFQVYDKAGAIPFHSDDEDIFEPNSKIYTGNLKGEADFKVKCKKGCGNVHLTPGVGFQMPEGFQESHKHSVTDTSLGRESVTFRRTTRQEPEVVDTMESSDADTEEDNIKLDLHIGSVSYKTLEQDWRYIAKEVAGDGSCFWHSLEVHTGLAAMEIKRLCANVEFPVPELQGHLIRQMGEGVYAEEVAIMAAAMVLGAVIVICNKEKGQRATFLPHRTTDRKIHLELEAAHYRPIFPANGCLITAIAMGLQRRECDVLKVIDEQVGDSKIWLGSGVAPGDLEFFFKIFDICAHIDTDCGSRVLNTQGRFPLSFKLREDHITFVGRNTQVSIEINRGEQYGLCITDQSMIFIEKAGSQLKYHATRERASVLAKSFESGSTGVLNSKLFNGAACLITADSPLERHLVVTGLFGTFGAGKSTVFKGFFELNEGKGVFYVSPRRALADEFRGKVQLDGKIGKLRSKHWKVMTLEIFLKRYHLVKPGMALIIDEIRLYPPGYLDLLGLLIPEGVHIIVGGDPCQSEYDSEKDRAWLSMLERDVDRLLANQDYYYNVLSRRFQNPNFSGRLPCELPIEVRRGQMLEHYLACSLEEVKAIGSSYCRTFLVSSFEEKKIVESHFFDQQPKVFTFGESTGLNLKKGTILITNIAHLTSERRWITALSRFSKNVCLANLTGTPWSNLVTAYKDRVLARFLTRTASIKDLHSWIPGRPDFREGFGDNVGRNEGVKEEKLAGDPWLKGMLDLFQLEDVEEEEELIEECQEEWFKTHLPQAELEGVRARWVHKILAKEFREVRMGYNVSEQFTHEYAKENGKILTNAAERFEAIYPRHRANDTVTFFMAVKKRLRFSKPSTEKAKLIEAQMYGKFLLNEFLKRIPLKGKHEPHLMRKAKADFEEKKVSKSAATIENHSGRSCRDWLIDIGLIFSKSQLCTKFDNRFRVAKAAQSIVCFQHAVLCRFAPYMRYIEMKLQQALPSNYYIHSGMGLEELNAWVKKGGFSGICTESDYEAFDASQDQYMVAFEVEIMRFLGLPMDLIEDYKFIKTHLGSKLGNFAIMRFSGEASTFLFNTMANMLFTFLRYEIKGSEYICFAGDDMCASERLATKKNHEGFLAKLKLKAKVFMVDKPTFCGWHLCPDGIYKKPQLVMERMCIAKEKNNLANCIDNYAIEVSFAYRLGERAVNRMDEEEVEPFYNCVRIIVKNKHLLKSDIAKLFSRALND
ncbi:replicase [Stevia carlavirus 1]|uniref:Replicase n=1 Tax=Stevia carlavirus 1 TaxID=2794421 RepID=A0AAE9T3G9_9VIRU|nr:replicase [Stevia carlavirus 1]